MHDTVRDFRHGWAVVCDSWAAVKVPLKGLMAEPDMTSGHAFRASVVGLKWSCMDCGKVLYRCAIYIIN